MDRADSANILLIFCDQMRWDCLGCAGNSVIQTPHLDRLAGMGVRYSHAYSTGPLCVPARAQMLTGQPSWLTGVWGLADRLSPLLPTFADRLKDRGYSTTAVGKMHFEPTGGAGDAHEPHGFDTLLLSEEVLPSLDVEKDDYWQYLDSHGYGYVGKYTHGKRSPDHYVMGYQAQTSELPLEHFDTTWTCNQTLRQLDRVRDNPFFMMCSFVKPHFPCELPSDWPCPYDPADIPLDPSYTGCPEYEHESFYSQSVIQRSTHQAGWLDEQVLREFAAYYYGNITLIDQQVGRLLAYLDEHNLTDNTWIIFSSDHGEHLGGHDMVGKTTFYDESTRVPMIISGPGVSSQGVVDDQPVMLEDLAATFVDIASGQALPRQTGVSLVPALKDSSVQLRDQMCGVMGGAFHFEPDNAHCFIRHDRWKYMYQFKGGCQKLYDCQDDPAELHDIAADQPAVCDELHGRLADWLVKHEAGFLVHHGRLKDTIVS